MNKAIFIPICLFIILVYSCSGKETRNDDKDEIKQENAITKIVFATGGCYGECPLMAIEIDSSLNVKFHGVKYTELHGFYLGKVTDEYWDSLNLRLEGIKFRELDTAYFNSVDDLSTEMYVYYDNGKMKYIQGQSASLPIELMSFYDNLMNSINRMGLEQTADSLIFITKRQIPLAMPVVYIKD